MKTLHFYLWDVMVCSFFLKKTLCFGISVSGFFLVIVWFQNTTIIKWGGECSLSIICWSNFKRIGIISSINVDIIHQWSHLSLKVFRQIFNYTFRFFQLYRTGQAFISISSWVSYNWHLSCNVCFIDKIRQDGIALIVRIMGSYSSAS